MFVRPFVDYRCNVIIKQWLLCFLLSNISHSDTITHQYATLFRPAVELQELLSPIYPNALFSAQNNHMIIRANNHELHEIMELLATFDTPLKHFTLTLSSILVDDLKQITHATQKNAMFCFTSLLIR